MVCFLTKKAYIDIIIFRYKISTNENKGGIKSDEVGFISTIKPKYFISLRRTAAMMA